MGDKYINKSQNIDKTANNLTGLVPIGEVSTKKYSLIVFPNSHIHRLDIKNTTKKSEKRTVVVFWLINPNKKIISTKDVDRQQTKIKLSDAKKYRLNLMKERKYHKQNFNIRHLSLCEH